MTKLGNDPELEAKVRQAFRSDAIPTAPATLRDALERIPDARLTELGRRSAEGRGRSMRGVLGALGIAAILVLGGALALAVGGRLSTVQPTPSPSPATTPALTFQVLWSDAAPYTADRLTTEVDLIRQRLAVARMDAAVTAEGQDRIVVVAPLGANGLSLRKLVTLPGRIAFVPLGDRQVEKGDPVDPTLFPPLFGADGIADARLAIDSNGGARTVEIDLAPRAASEFSDYTTTHIGSYFAITLDDVVLTAPLIQSAIPGGKIVITNAPEGWAAAAATELVAFLRVGPLPAPTIEIVAGMASQDPNGPLVPTPDVASDPPSFELERTTQDGCDTIIPPYRSFLIHIDPAAPEPVWAVADTGARLAVRWGQTSRGLVGLVGPPAVVMDGSGAILARDGTRVDIPLPNWPSLAGRFVCPGPDAVYVLDQPA